MRGEAGAGILRTRAIRHVICSKPALYNNLKRSWQKEIQLTVDCDECCRCRLFRWQKSASPFGLLFLKGVDVTYRRAKCNFADEFTFARSMLNALPAALNWNLKPSLRLRGRQRCRLSELRCPPSCRQSSRGKARRKPCRARRCSRTPRKQRRRSWRCS